MVSSLLADALTNPTDALKDLFDPNTDLDSFPDDVAAHFSVIFSDADALQEIPRLNITYPPEAHADRALVQFRAMIQDTSPSPEMYLARKNSTQCGGWGLGMDDATDRINYADLRECTILWAVSIPGENSWCYNPLGSTLNTQDCAVHRPPRPHKFPVPSAPHIGVQIKLYGNRRAEESFKSTELRTFIGILTSEPLHADIDSPTMNTVPTLHVFFSLPVPTTITPRIYPTTPSTTSVLREELITWISESSLAGDRDVAEWILLCAIARVQSRNPPILPLSITVSRFPPPSSVPNAKSFPTLTYVLSKIFPISNVLPLTLETLNSTRFVPESMDEDLHSGWLQLPRGSICVVTEGGVTEGIVAERGLTNLRATQEIMNTQTLDYIFPYSRFVFDTDVAFVILSEGRKSAFFQTNVNIMLNPVKPNFDFYDENLSAVVCPSEEKLEMFRSLVGAAKVGNVSINEQVAEFIQEDFVKERKAAASPSDTLSSDDLIRRMMLARLLALSLQETEISVPIWEKAKALEIKSKHQVVQ